LDSRDEGIPLTLEDNDSVAVMGAGPAGSFFSYFLLLFAERLGIEIKLDIYEPRDFTAKGPVGCNMCGGIISESLIQSLAMEGINIPDTVVQRGIDSYVMHTEAGTERIETPTHEKRIAAVHRGGGPRTAVETKFESFDNYLLQMAVGKGAKIHSSKVTGLDWKEGKPEVSTDGDQPQIYDLLVGAVGVNTPGIKLFENLGFRYRRPEIIKTFITEIDFGAATVRSLFGSAMHVFLLNLPRLDFAALIPKGDFVTLCLLGSNINQGLIDSFYAHPEVQRCFPPGWSAPKNMCRCMPKMSIGEAHQPFSDRVVLVGDCAASRLFKDGIGAAFRTARAAARTAIFSGISTKHFERGYRKECRRISRDNLYGKLIFFVIHIAKNLNFSSRVIVEALVTERNKASALPHMGMMLWDMFTGSSPYKDIFFRVLGPGFISRYFAAFTRALFKLVFGFGKSNKAADSV